MGYSIYLICHTCDSDKGTNIDLDTDGEELMEWVIKHWGHHIRIYHYSEDKEFIELDRDPLASLDILEENVKCSTSWS